MGAIKVDKEIFENLKQAYSERFGSSPTSLINRLNQAYQEELDDCNDDLISHRTIRGFFNASTPPKMQEKNLNYLCSVLLEYKSYREALKKLIKIEPDLEKDWLEPYWKHLKRKCSTIRVLDMTEPVSLTNIYVNFNILKDIKGRRQQRIQTLLSDLDIDKNQNIKRLPSPKQENQIPGLEAVKRYPKLMILGKPGAGKTTFLKHLAINSNLEESMERLIPVFIQLKEFSENENLHDLASAIMYEFTEYIPNSEATIERLLERGQCLIMLDGLDEVNVENREVYREIDRFTRSFPENHFVITSRTAACDYVFKDFTEVEAADFGWEQVETFVLNWFTTRGEEEVSREFLKKLEENQPIKELATNPLLLTILCWTFDDTYDFTRNRHGLYADAVDSLLRRWDASRRIDRKPNVKISRQRKIAMFSEIAYEGLNHNPPKILWQKWELEQKISEFVESISFEIDTHDVLREIEANYGLLIQQAKGIYSFSHLTFQEYFAAEYVVENRDTISLNDFVEQHLIEREWREVFILITERLNKAKANEFLKQMFKRTNDIVKNSQPLQQMLKWLDRMTDDADVKSSSWRALYLAIDLDVDLYISHEIEIEKIPFAKLATDMRSFNKKRQRIIPKTAKAELISGLAGILALAVSYAEKNINTRFNIDRETSDFTRQRLKVDRQSDIKENLSLAIAKAQENSLTNLAKDLTQLQISIPCNDYSDSEWENWVEKLRNIMLKHLDIGHKVDFEAADIKALEDYIYAHQVILECVGTESYSSKELREEIVDNLLLANDKISPHLLTN